MGVVVLGGGRSAIHRRGPVSHVYAFGCTEEKLRKLVFGLKPCLKQIGDPSDKRQQVRPHQGRRLIAPATSLSSMGSTRDALSRNIGVALLLVETTGALGFHGYWIPGTGSYLRMVCPST